MIQDINLEQIKQYNESLKQYRAKSAQLNAEIEYINKEIETLSAELTAELGITVTKDNIEQICKEQAEKINNSLQSGNAVLAKIASEEQNASAVQAQTTSQPVVTQQVVQPTPVAPVAQPTAVSQATPVVNTQPVMSEPVVSNMPVAQAPVQGSVFNGQNSTLPTPGDGTTLPPLFSLG